MIKVFYISVTDEASDFKFGKTLGLPGPIIKSHAEKSGRGHGLGELPKMGFPFNISATNEDSDFKIGRLVRFPRPIIKSHPEKEGVALS